MLRNLASKAKSTLLLVAGGAALGILGRDKVYQLAQGDGFAGKFLRSYIGSFDLEWLTRHWQHLLNDGQSPRLNAASRAQYGMTDPGGWTREKQNRGDSHLPLGQQMRGMIIPMIEAAIEEGKSRVVEIGAGDGKILQFLAKKYPKVEFIGVDFLRPEFVDEDLQNLSHITGYALELLEKGHLTGDLLFACSTFILPGPREIEAYAREIAKAGFGTVIVNDPITRGYSPEKFPGTSRHQTIGLWGHDYRYYFGQVGYRTSHFEIQKFYGHKKIDIAYRYLVRLDR
jgi:hypothetical protein